MAKVNTLYHSYASSDKLQELYKMMEAKNSEEYYAAKRTKKSKLNNWQKPKRLLLVIALPLVYFAFCTNIIGENIFNVHLESVYDKMQTNRQFERHEKILEFENTMPKMRVLTCSTCMENHPIHVEKEKKEGTARVCHLCKKRVQLLAEK